MGKDKKLKQFYQKSYFKKAKNDNLNQEIFLCFLSLRLIVVKVQTLFSLQK